MKIIMELTEGYNFFNISSLFEEKGVKAFAAHIPFKIIDDAIFILKLEDFLSFISENQVKHVFIHEQYVEPDDYKITEETFKALGVRSTVMEFLENSIVEYNNTIDCTEFELPEMIIALFVWNGQRFYHPFQNEILIDEDVLLNPEDKLSEMILDNEQDIVEANESKRNLVKEQQENLRMQILADPKFRECTNNRLRRNYIIGIFEGSQVPKELKAHWVNPNGFLCQGAFDFIDSIWRELKGTK